MTSTALAAEQVRARVTHRLWAQSSHAIVHWRGMQRDHHPEWFNVYNKVNVVLATHTCDGVSDKVHC